MSPSQGESGAYGSGEAPYRGADLKPAPRVRDPQLLRALHLEWLECVICYSTGHPIGGLSLHHLLNKPRDDVRPNLVMLCGSGTTGCHGLVEAYDRQACGELAVYLIRHRLDTMEYLGERLGGVVAVRDWLQRRLYLAL